MNKNKLIDSCLEQSVKREIKKIIQRVKYSRLFFPNRIYNVSDYPAVVVACKCEWNRYIYHGESRSPVNYKYVDKLKNKLETIGVIGTKRKDCHNIIGACAEPHAADKVLRNINCNLKNLRFSKAYRPRTSKSIRYCLNCKQTFKGIL